MKKQLLSISLCLATNLSVCTEGPKRFSVARVALTTGKRAAAGLAIHAAIISAIMLISSNNTAEYKDYRDIWIYTLKSTDVPFRLLLAIPVGFTLKGLYDGYKGIP